MHRRVLAEPNMLPGIHMSFGLFYRAYPRLAFHPNSKVASRVKQVFIMSKGTEEATKEAARRTVTEGFTDPDTIRLLSAAGDAAKRSRPISPLPRSHLQQVHTGSWDSSRLFV
jgi:hypothetical protein